MNQKRQRTYAAAADTAEDLDPATITAGSILRGAAAAAAGHRPGRKNLDPTAPPGQTSRTRTLRLPPHLELALEEHLTTHPNQTLSSISRRALTAYLANPHPAGAGETGETGPATSTTRNLGRGAAGASKASRPRAFRLPPDLDQALAEHLTAHPGKTFTSVLRHALTTHLANPDPTGTDTDTGGGQLIRDQHRREGLAYYRQHPPELDRAITLFTALLDDAVDELRHPPRAAANPRPAGADTHGHPRHPQRQDPPPPAAAAHPDPFPDQTPAEPIPDQSPTPPADPQPTASDDEAPPPPRPWTLSELRTAAYLSHGGTPARPDVTALARHVGVTPRTVQRWLAGDTRPTPGNAAKLRAALLPDAEVLARQRDERRFAETATVAMAAPRGRRIADAWLKQGWHTPHLLQHLRHPHLHAERLTVTLAHPAKPTPTPRGWTVVASITYPNRPLALLGKHQILDHVAAYRIVLRPALAAKGRTDCWLDTAPTTDITTLKH